MAERGDAFVTVAVHEKAGLLLIDMMDIETKIIRALIQLLVEKEVITNDDAVRVVNVGLAEMAKLAGGVIRDHLKERTAQDETQGS